VKNQNVCAKSARDRHTKSAQVQLSHWGTLHGPVCASRRRRRLLQVHILLPRARLTYPNELAPSAAVHSRRRCTTVRDGSRRDTRPPKALACACRFFSPLPLFLFLLFYVRTKGLDRPRNWVCFYRHLSVNRNTPPQTRYYHNAYLPMYSMYIQHRIIMTIINSVML